MIFLSNWKLSSMILVCKEQDFFVNLWKSCLEICLQWATPYRVKNLGFLCFYPNRAFKNTYLDSLLYFITIVLTELWPKQFHCSVFSENLCFPLDIIGFVFLSIFLVRLKKHSIDKAGKNIIKMVALNSSQHLNGRENISKTQITLYGVVRY